MLEVTLCKSFDDAVKLAEEKGRIAAIECEYGKDTLTEEYKGVEVAMYHHGEHSDKPAPSVRWDVYDQLEEPIDHFIVSHIDLDTIMGIMWASKILKPSDIAKDIGKLAEIQDLNGFHYIEKNVLKDLHPNIKYRYLAIGYLLNKNINIEDYQNPIIDVSKMVHKTILKIKDMIIDGPSDEIIEQIDNWLKNKSDDAKTHRKISGIINVFKADKSLLSAYCIDGECSDINIQFNTGNNSITISAFNEDIAKKYFGKNGVITPLKEFFKEEVGGRISVGGTARDVMHTWDECIKFYKYIQKNYLNNSKKHIMRDYA